jgi:hypothetical protein
MRFVLFWNIVVFLNKRSFYCWKLFSFLSLWCLAEKWENDPQTGNTQRKSLLVCDSRFSLYIVSSIFCCLTDVNISADVMLSTGPEIKVTSGDIIRCFTDIRHYPGVPPHISWNITSVRQQKLDEKIYKENRESQTKSDFLWVFPVCGSFSHFSARHQSER